MGWYQVTLSAMRTMPRDEDCLRIACRNCLALVVSLFRTPLVVLSQKFVYKFDAMHAGFPTVAAVIEGGDELSGQGLPPLLWGGETPSRNYSHLFIQPLHREIYSAWHRIFIIIYAS